MKNRYFLTLLTCLTPLLSSTVFAGSLAVNGAAAKVGAFGLKVTPTITELCHAPINEVIIGPGVITGNQAGCATLLADNVAVVTPGAKYKAGSQVQLTNNFSVDSGAPLEIVINNAISPLAYVQDSTPQSEQQYHAQFSINIDPLSTLDATAELDIFSAYSSNGDLQFRITLTSDSLVLAARTNTGMVTEFTQPAIPATGWVDLLVSWRAGTTDGMLTASVAGKAPTGLMDLSNDSGRIDTVRMGNVGGNRLSITGSYYMDDFHSWR